MSKEQTLKKEDEIIEQAFQRLLNDYLASPHGKKVDIIQKAFHFAKNAHSGIRRLSGEPYILHPIAVAHIACKEIGLGSTSICAALLHDVVEDTDYTVDDIRDLFGDKIAEIVSGLTKISGGVFGEQASAQAENFKKLIITMSKDVRVILIKIADRLHNMRTLDSQPKAKQYKIAGETEYIYAPLAHRLGLYPIKTELEDLSFKYNFPEDYHFISTRLEAERKERMELYDRFSLPIMNSLISFGYKFVMKERIKSAYSIWNKMQTKHIPFEEVYDILGARIVFEPHPGADEKQECWRIYNLITQIYTPHPERTRNWLNTPKSNGYEALHVTVMGPDGLWIEVQIRSQRMDDIAEKGLAAHWNYKKDYSGSESKIEEWLSTVNELLKKPDSDAMHFLDTFKLSLYDAEIFVFTPKGEMKTMPQGATALDFAFEIHSDIGMHCIGAKVNNKLVPLNYVLQSGDQVEILTAQQQTPQPEWVNYVTTMRAKDKLNAVSKQSNRILRNKGEQMLRDALEALGFVVKKDLPQDILQKLLEHFKVATYDALLLGIGKEELNLNDLIEITKNEGKHKLDLSAITKVFRNNKKNAHNEEALPKGTQIPSPCCNPIPGDEVIAFENFDGTCSIHVRNCPEAMRLKTARGPKIVPVVWEKSNKLNYTARIDIQGIDRKKMLLDIVQVISDHFDNNINKLQVSTIGGIYNATIDINVNNTDEIKDICKHLQGIPDVEHVARVYPYEDPH